MITAEHIDQAHARLHEHETLTGYAAGTPEWFECMGELVGAEPLALTEEALRERGPLPIERFRGLLIGMLARQYADAEKPPGLEGAAVERSRRRGEVPNDHPPAEVGRSARDQVHERNP